LLTLISDWYEQMRCRLKILAYRFS
jgi:hypothetical protein